MLGIEGIQSGEGLLVCMAREGCGRCADRLVAKRSGRSRVIKEPPTGRGAVAAAGAAAGSIGRLLERRGPLSRSPWSLTD